VRKKGLRPTPAIHLTNPRQLLIFSFSANPKNQKTSANRKPIDWGRNGFDGDKEALVAYRVLIGS